MTVRRQFRRFLPALLSLPLAAVMFVPASASAATSSQQPYFTVWQAGTPMPAAPAGYTVMVWPPQQVLQTLKVGQTVPAVVMTATQATKMAATPASYTGLEDAAGQVNLEFVPTPYSCVPGQPVFKADEGTHSTAVMQSYSTINGTTENFNYGLGQSTTVGVGSSGSGNSGTFGASGTAGITDTGHSQQFWPQQSNRSFNHWQTFFEWGKYLVPNSCPQLDRYIIKPYKWNAGDAFVHPSGAPGATHCTPELKGGGLTQSGTTATTFGVGFSVLGFSGTAQTGYDQSAEISMFFPGSAGQLCGVNGTPPNNPGVLVES